jgi:hypothetical protein
MNSESAVRAFHKEIVSIAQKKLARPLSVKERTFISSRGGFIALKLILDTVKAGTAREVEEYLNSE